MKSKLFLLVVALCAAVMPAHAAPTALPNIEGPDVPALTQPVAVLHAFDNERFDGCAGKVSATKSVAVPAGSYDRAILDFVAQPDGDPWDRLFRVSIQNVEVLRGTTPRTTIHLRRDITEYLSLLHGDVKVSLELGTYVGAQVGSVAIELYSSEPTAALVRARAARVVPVVNGVGLTYAGRSVGGEVDFGSAPPAKAIIDLTLSNHGDEEAQFARRTFHVLVDGHEIAAAPAMPYVYAIAGFGGENANNACHGPGTSVDGDTIHPVLWWTAQQGADVAGIHLGVGEIPPYRATVDAADLALLTGAKTVTVLQEGGRAVWVTSLSVLLG
jgi:hypothetical protein